MPDAESGSEQQGARPAPPPLVEAVGSADDGSPRTLPPPPSHAMYAQHSDKPFLGGYRNPKSGSVFHNAATQTAPLPKPTPARPCGVQAAAGTQTQTAQRNHAVQCPRDASTQCRRLEWAEDPTDGKVLEPTAPYVSGEQVTAQRAAAAVCIQRFARGWLTRRAVAPLQQARADLAAFYAEQAGQQEAETEAARQYEVQRRMQPRVHADFVLLYDELAMWWGQEQTKIAAAEGITEEERQAARRALLAKETKLLQTIDRLKLAAAPMVRAEKAAKQLAAAAAPRQWVLPAAGGRVVEVVTPATLRAGELAGAYYVLLGADGSSLDARLAALLAVKFHAKAVDCSLTREIVGLVDREADLLHRGRDTVMMAGLRTRLANLFLEFVQAEQKAAAAAAASGGSKPSSSQRRRSGRQPAGVLAA